MFVNPQDGKLALPVPTGGWGAQVQLVNSPCLVGFQTGPITFPVSSKLTPRIFRPALNFSALAARVALSSTTSCVGAALMIALARAWSVSVNLIVAPGSCTSDSPNLIGSSAR